MSSPEHSPLINSLHRLDRAIYAAVAILLGILAVSLLGYAVWTAVHDLPNGLLAASIDAVLNLLLVLIIMELFRTALGMVGQEDRKLGAPDLIPFLVVAGISVLRRMISLGIILGADEVKGTLTAEHFNRAMIELGVSAGVLLVVAVVLAVLRSYSLDSRTAATSTPAP